MGILNMDLSNISLDNNIDEDESWFLSTFGLAY